MVCRQMLQATPTIIFTSLKNDSFLLSRPKGLDMATNGKLRQGLYRAALIGLLVFPVGDKSPEIHKTVLVKT
jgi:hypothetical protein